MNETNCPWCGGEGVTVDESTCEFCDGTGILESAVPPTVVDCDGDGATA